MTTTKPRTGNPARPCNRCHQNNAWRLCTKCYRKVCVQCMRDGTTSYRRCVGCYTAYGSGAGMTKQVPPAQIPGASIGEQLRRDHRLWEHCHSPSSAAMKQDKVLEIKSLLARLRDVHDVDLITLIDEIAQETLRLERFQLTLSEKYRAQDEAAVVTANGEYAISRHDQEINAARRLGYRYGEQAVMLRACARNLRATLPDKTEE